MKIEILTVGKPRTSYIKEGVSDYLKRLRSYVSLSVRHVPDYSRRKRPEKVLEEEGKEILGAVGRLDF